MRTLYVLTMTIYLCLGVWDVFGDGCFLPRTNDEANVYAPDQKAIIHWHEGRQTMILSTKLRSNRLDDFGWIIPIKADAAPKVELAKSDIFFAMSHWLDPPHYGKGFGFGCAAMPAARYAGIEIIEQKELDIYDVTVLRASNAEQLYAWLRDNEFKLPQRAETVLRHYTNNDFYFVTARLDLRNAHSRQIDMLQQRGVYDSIERLIAEEAKLTNGYGYSGLPGARDILQAALQQKPYESHWRDQVGSDEYYRLRSTLAGESAEQNLLQEAIDNVTGIMMELHRGVARPLRIDFETEQTFFPLRISRINSGDVNVLVYVLSHERMIDETGLLELTKEKKIDEHFRLEVKGTLDLEHARYASRFTFYGPSERFEGDIYFTPRRLNPAERLFEPLFLGW